MEPRLVQARECGHWRMSVVVDEIVEGQAERVPKEIIPPLCHDCAEARRNDPATQARVAAYLASGKMQQVVGAVKDARVGEITDQLCNSVD